MPNGEIERAIAELNIAGRSWYRDENYTPTPHSVGIWRTALQAQIKPECEICKPDVMEGNPITWKHSDGYVGDGKFSSAGRIASHCPNCGKELTKNG